VVVNILTKSNFREKGFYFSLAYSFRGSVHYHGGKHGGVQADMVLEKELRVLHLDLKATEGQGLSM